MLQIFKYPSQNEWEALTCRPFQNDSRLVDSVHGILNDVRINGDASVKKYGRLYDRVNPENLLVGEAEIKAAAALTPPELQQAVLTAKANIEKFHAAQRYETPAVETVPGVRCWQRSVPVEKVGLYVPGGTAPLFSTVLMLAVPAKLAGCREIILCTPPAGANVEIHPAIAFAAGISGVDKVFRAGGVQAIGAMAYGTESIPKVYKIFGPGNRYVTAAKQIVGLRDVAVDMPAGPSEVEVIADDTARPAFVAADLLSQAEHGADSQALLVTDSLSLAEAVAGETLAQLSLLPRKDFAEKSLANSRIIVLRDKEEIVGLTNMYAPEHLIVETENPMDIAGRISNAGSIFLGHYAPESAGDYASGTNHTLPTNGYARMYSGISLDSFMKKITFQEITREGLLNLGQTVRIMAEHEGLFAHRNAVTLRMEE